MKNKNILKLLLSSLFLVAFLSSCDKNLPYPIDEVERGALIDISKLAGTDGNNTTLDPATANIGVKLQMVEKGAGNYAKVQLAVLWYRASTNDEKYIMVQDNITSLPVDVNVNLTAVVAALGITPAVNDYYYFTTNVIMPNGMVIPGYNVYSGYFNNNNFTGYLVPKGDGTTRAYSPYISYKVQ